MSTRSRIAVEIEGGKVLSVYCHNDGYIDGVGKSLLRAFPDGTNSSKVQAFVNEGDRTSSDMSYKEWRDEDCPPRENQTVPGFFNGDIEEYGYLYTVEGQWLVKPHRAKEPQLLKEVLA